MIYIDIDYTSDGGGDSLGITGRAIGEMPLYGMERMMGVSNELTDEGDLVEFRLKDDDGELALSGRLNDDGECDNQTAALRYGESYAGATTIEVRRAGQWVAEIA